MKHSCLIYVHRLSGQRFLKWRFWNKENIKLIFAFWALDKKLKESWHYSILIRKDVYALKKNQSSEISPLSLVLGFTLQVNHENGLTEPARTFKDSRNTRFLRRPPNSPRRSFIYISVAPAIFPKHQPKQERNSEFSLWNTPERRRKICIQRLLVASHIFNSNKLQSNKSVRKWKES